MAENGSTRDLRISQLFKLMVDNGASDLHISVGSAPGMRIHGDIVRVKIDPLTPAETKKLIYQVLSEEQINTFEKEYELDFSFGIKGLARFRGNVFYGKGAVCGVFRLVPSSIPDFETLNLPKILLEMTDVKNGLILVTGPTGSGKSTTLAAMIDRLNEKEPGHIITLEDPIEFMHQHKSSVMTQREVGSDCIDFQKGIKSMLRQDPDIVLVGELRDPETVEAALTIAETGHLVFGTLHTNSAVQTLNRVINVFDADRKDQVRTLLSFVLQGVVAQSLIAKSFTPGRIACVEVMIPTAGIRNLIREDKIHQIYSQMQIGQDKTGMITMNQSLKKAVDNGIIDQDTAMSNSTVPEEMAKMLGVKAKGMV